MYLIQADRAPTFAAPIFNYSVPEGTLAGEPLSAALPITSSNQNLRNIPLYRILSSNPPTRNFVIDPLSGQLSLWAGVTSGALVYDATAQYPIPNTYVLSISAQVRSAISHTLTFVFKTAQASSCRSLPLATPGYLGTMAVFKCNSPRHRLVLCALGSC